VLSHGLLPNQWRAAQNGQGVIASCHLLADKNNKIVMQQLISNAFSSVVDSRDNNNNNNNSSTNSNVVTNHTEENMPQFTQETLAKMTVTQLRDVCKRYNIIQGKKKEQHINNILKRVSSVHSHATELATLQKQLTTLFFSDPAPLHVLYGDLFNFIDLADRYWYKVDEAHSCHFWKAKLLFGILRIASLNCWVFGVQTKYEDWLDFRKILAAVLIKCKL
jgi:hypothetical protein